MKKDKAINISKRIRMVRPSATMAMSIKAKEMEAKGADIINFAIGEPNFPVPKHIKKAAVSAVSKNYSSYTSSFGILELRKALTKKLEKENGVEYTTNEIIVTGGAKMALYEAITALIDKNDEVLIAEPYWVSYPDMVLLAGGKPVYIPTKESEGFELTADMIEKKITPKTKLLIINSPNNPTGSVIEKSDLAKIADLAIKHNLFIISDECYEKIIYDGKKNYSIASLDNMKERTITINSFSKSYGMTGWRLGYAAAPEEIIKAMNKIQTNSLTCASSVVQYAGIAALEGPQIFLEKIRKSLEKRLDYVVEELNKIPNVTCSLPAGAFYVFPNFSAYGTDSVELANQLLEKANVSVTPGNAFGKSAQGYQRISYATSMANLKEGLKRIKDYLS